MGVSCACTWYPSFGWEAVIVVFSSCMLLGFITTYVIAVCNDHVIPDFPYISDTGGYPPESCIFTLILSLGACVMFCIVMIRFRYISHHFDYKVLKVLNYLSLIFGVSSAVGMIVVGSFQTTLVFPVHMAGAIVAFGGGLVFAGFNTAITFVLVRRNRDSKHRLIIQILLMILGILCFVLAFGIGGVAESISVDDKPKYEHNPYLKPYHSYYVASSITEWTMAIVLMLYFLTFYNEFKQAKVSFKAMRLDIEEGEMEALLS